MKTRSSSLALALGLSLIAAPAFAQFSEAPDNSFGARLQAQAAERGEAIQAGSEVVIRGMDFKPGQEVTLSRGTQVLNETPLVADEKGGIETRIKLPEDAVVGRHAIMVGVEKPAFATTFELKVSPVVPLSGEDGFDVTANKLVRGLYQVAYSEKNGTLFVTSAVGRPPVKQSELLKLDPATLETVATATPAAAPPVRGQENVFAVYGVGVDDANDNVWVTNTRQDTVAVYKQSDLSLVKQFDPGTATHARDVLISQKLGRAYASATGTNQIIVFDAKSLDVLDPIEISSNERRGSFSVGSLDLDDEGGKLYAVSLSTNELAVVDLAEGKVEKVISLPTARSAIGVAYSSKSKRVFVAAQGSDNVLIVDPESGEVLHDVATGAGPLNVTLEPQSDLAFVSNRGSGTVTVINAEGKIVANLAGGTFPNHVSHDDKGNVFAINKSRGEDDAEGDRISRLTSKK